MKHKISLALLALFFTVPAIAQHRHHGHGHHHHRWHHNHGWVVPAIIGGAVVYAVTRPDPIVVQQPQPIIVQSNQVMIDGVIYTRQIMIVNGIQQEVLVRQ